MWEIASNTAIETATGNQEDRAEYKHRRLRGAVETRYISIFHDVIRDLMIMVEGNVAV
jgi:hypothetical protein